MSTWFKTVNNLYCNKFAKSLLNPQTSEEVFEHLLRQELKGRLPTSLMIENPSDEFRTVLNQLNNKMYLSPWELGLTAKNFTFLNWLLRQENFKFNRGDIPYLFHFLSASKPADLPPNFAEFLKLLLAKLPTEVIPQVNQPPQSLPYNLLQYIPESFYEAIIPQFSPTWSEVANLPAPALLLVKKYYPDKFVLLNNIEQYEQVRFSPTVHLPRISEDLWQKLDSFFQAAKLGQGVRKILGVNSKAVVKVMDQKLLIRHRGLLKVNYDFLNYVLFLQELFNPVENSSDFGKYLVQDELWIKLAPLHENNNLTVLIKILQWFNPVQVKKILGSAMPSTAITLLTLVDQNPEYFKQLIMQTDFKNVNTFAKMFKLVEEKSEYASTPLRFLNQAQHFPQVSELMTMNLPEGYEITIAQTNHDLIRWGVDMGHCIGNSGYQRDAENGRCLLFALSLKGKAKYAVEVREDEVVQIQGKSRVQPSKLLTGALYKALEHVNLIRRY